MTKKEQETTEMLRMTKLWDYLVITLAMVITSAAVYFFMIPGKVAVGSASALAMVLSNFIPLPVSAITFILNAVLLLLGFLLIGREFGAKTVYASLLLPVLLGIYEQLFPDIASLSGDPLLDVICYILVAGLGLSILFSRNASSGGLDIVAKLMNKYLHLEMGRAMALSGMLVALSSAFCYDRKTVILSVIATYFGGLLMDHFIFGINIKRRVCIVSKKQEQITDYILHTLHSGASLYTLFGAYDRKSRQEIIAIVDKQEYRQLMDYIHRTDPDAFVTVYAVNEVRYRPKNKK